MSIIVDSLVLELLLYFLYAVGFRKSIFYSKFLKIIQNDKYALNGALVNLFQPRFWSYMKFFISLLFLSVFLTAPSYSQGILSPLESGMSIDEFSEYVFNLVDKGEAELMFNNNPKFGYKIVNSDFSAGKYDLYLFVQPIFKKKELADVVVWANRKGVNLSGKSLNKAYHEEIIDKAQKKAAEFGILMPFIVSSERSGYQNIHFIVAHLELGF